MSTIWALPLRGMPGDAARGVAFPAHSNGQTAFSTAGNSRKVSPPGWSAARRSHQTKLLCAVPPAS
eukprot:6549495-Alexandrium_andersonii.AAC.1